MCFCSFNLIIQHLTLKIILSFAPSHFFILMANNVNITSNGIQKVLKNYNEKQALAEYIWNGFDAKANKIEINYKANKLGYIESLEIQDNGYGINFKNVKSKFDTFYESEKALQLAVNKNKSVMHGKNGVGRLTFFKFANDAEWQTTFQQAATMKSAVINVDISSLNNYKSRLLEETLRKETGTKVVFSNVRISEDYLLKEAIPFLKAEFCWFLELNKKRKFTILINGKTLDYKDQILHYEDNIPVVFNDRTVFKLKFVQWKESLHKELSKVYFINDKGEEQHKEYTTLNKKADEYFHSVFIESEFFTDFDFNGSESDTQIKLYNRSKSSNEFKFLMKHVNELLRNKRRPFLKEHSHKFIEKYKEERVIPRAKAGKKNKDELLSVLRGLYEVKPKLFSNLSLDQKKTMVSLMDALLSSTMKSSMPALLGSTLGLDKEDKAELAAVFQQAK